MTLMLNGGIALVAALALSFEGSAPMAPTAATGAPVGASQAELAPPKGGRRPSGTSRPASRPQGGKHTGGGSHSRPPARGGSVNNINHNNINRNNVNVNVNNHGGGHYDDHYHGHHDHWDDWDDHWHPLETAATVAVTAAVVGAIVHSIPPNCSTVVVNGISYSQCGSTWYQPQYVGSSVQYVVVNPPR